MRGNIYNGEYQFKILNTLNKALIRYPRVTVIRCELYFPEEMTVIEVDSSILSKFISSLKAKIWLDLSRIEEKCGRRLSCHLHYAWVREYGYNNNRKHYHILIFLNGDVYHSLEDYSDSVGSLSAMIKLAWCGALGLNHLDFPTLVHFGEVFHLHRNRFDIDHTNEIHIEWANYLAKNETKRYGDGYRSIGTSQ